MSEIEKKESLHAGAVEIEKAIKEYYTETDPIVLKKLEDWQTFDYSQAFLNYPWLTSKRIRMMQNLAFTSNFANKNIKYKISKRYLKILFDIYRPLALTRFRYNLYHFPFDIKLGSMIANALY